MRLVFAGTPEVALPSLAALLAGERHEVLAVVTRPDAPAGRRRVMTPSPVKRYAVDRGIEVLTPRRPSEPEFLDALRRLAPDCCPVVAYGALVPQAALDVPPEGWVNLHFSLLPAWRGAAPVQRAIIAGDDITGATTFRLEKGLDTGPVFGVVTVGVGPRDTAGDLLDRLAVDGAGLLTATLDGIEDGTLSAVPQPSDGVSLAPKLTVDDARIEWSATAVAIDRLVRGCTPAPGAWTTLGEQRLGVGPVQPVAADDVGDDPLAPGDLRIDRREVLVGTGTGPVRLGELRPPGRAAMAAVDWARGLRLDAGARLQ